MTLPKSMSIDPGVVAEYDRLQASRLAQATRLTRAGQVRAILHYRANGMSERRLEQIYGRELVRVAALTVSE